MSKEDNEALDKINTEIFYERKFGSGGLIETYGHESIGFRMSGPFKDIKEGKGLPKLCFSILANMKILTEQINSKKGAELAEAAKKVEVPKSPLKKEPAKKEEKKEPEKKEKKKEPEKKEPDDPFDDDFGGGEAPVL